MSIMVLHNYGIRLTSGDNLTMIEELAKTIPILYSITITGAISYELHLQPINKKNNIMLKIGIIFMILGIIINLKAINRGYELLLFYQVLLIYLGSSIIIVALIGRINILNKYANKDRMTGAYNQRAFYNSIDLYIKKTKKLNSTFSVVFIDFDDFKSINDKYGHVTADVILKDICTKIETKIRKDDLLFRYGGDEFILLVPGSDKKETDQIMKRIESEVEKESNGIIHFSYGTASYPEEGGQAEILLKIADLQMYSKKNLNIP